MQGIFFGLPRSGKTSTKKRLMGKQPTLQQASTGVAEKVSRVEIERTTVRCESQLNWNEISELNDETAIVVEDIADHITTDLPHRPTQDNIKVTHGRMLKQSAAPSENLIRIIIGKVKAMFARNTDFSSTDSKSDVPLADPMQLLNSALSSKSPIHKPPVHKPQERELQWTLSLRCWRSARVSGNVTSSCFRSVPLLPHIPPTQRLE